MLNSKNIFVTGATGSVGRKVVETILDKYNVGKLIVYSRDEFKQSEMQMVFNHKALRYILGDVRDSQRLNQAMKDVDIVIHVAALKQVPAAEYNPMEFVKTNVNGAENVIKAAIENNVDKVIALSTDKASNPINLYGATKLASDKLFVAANNIVGNSRTRFAVVRYGNVVGSRGSVVPLFQKLMGEGIEYLPITHELMTRFWISSQQGVDFVLNSMQRMQGGEIFVPRVPSVRIMDLAKAMAPDLPTKIVGVRAGEKIHETMCTADDSRLIVEFKDHFVIRPTINIFDSDIDYRTNKLGEKGKEVELGFEYNSNLNPHFLTLDEILEFNKIAMS